LHKWKWGIFNLSGQASPESQLRAAPQGKIPSRQKSPPFVPHGLHGLFVGFRTIHASLFFSVTLFAKGKKDVCTPTATTVLHLRQKKNNSKLLYMTCSNGHSLA